MEKKDPAELPFFFRQFISWALQSAGIEKLPERETGWWPDFFDNTEGIGPIKRPNFYKGLPFKGRATPVDPRKKIGIECHVTAVAFGTSKRRRRYWRDMITSGRFTKEILGKYYSSDIDAAAQRMALHERFWKVPYHYVALLNGDILYNNPATRYTYHGNGGNGPMIGVSGEANLPGLEKWKDKPGKRPKKYHDLDEFFILTNRAMIDLAVKKERENGSPIELLTVHREYSAGRLGDPGEAYYKEIAKPKADELDLKIDYTFKHGSGNQICHEWDDDGLVDYRGRPI